MQLDFDKIIEAVAIDIDTLITIPDGGSLKLTVREIAQTAVKTLARELPSMNDFYNEALDMIGFDNECCGCGNRSYTIKKPFETDINVQEKEVGNE